MKLKAIPEKEDFRGKYEEDNIIAQKMLDGYFKTVKKLTNDSGINKKKSGRVIELGCGEGHSTRRINKFLRKNIILQASEYVARQINIAKELNPGIKITEENIYELPHKDKEFDLVYLLEVLEHLDYPDRALKEVSRILKDDGYMILGVPREPIWRALNMVRGKYLKGLGNTPGHLNHWSSNKLVSYLEKHFGVVEAKKTPLPWTIVLVGKHKR